MPKPMTRILAALVLALCGLFLAACDNGGSELPNELRGMVVQGGKPAPNVKVGLYSVNYIPADPGSSNQAWTTQTDANGQYAFRKIPSGRFNVVGVQDSLGFFRDSVSVSGAIDVGLDSLGSLGELSGTVRLQPQDEPRNAIVQVMGTDIYVNVDAAGAFTITGLAGGVYRLRVFVALPNYVPLFKVVEIHPGRHEILAEPLEPFYSGVPVVESVRVSLDTAKGIAKITWSPVSYPSLFTYLVYRDPLNSANLSLMPLNANRILDTVYYDTLYRRYSADTGYIDPAPHDWEYRVRVKANNSAIGEALAPAALHAVSPAVYNTEVTLARVGGDLQSVFRGDTLLLLAGFSSGAVESRKLVWIHGTADTLRRTDVAGTMGQDSLTWIAPQAQGLDSLRVEVTDVNGKLWSKQAYLRVSSARIIAETLRPANPIEAHAWDGKVVHVAQDTSGLMSIGIFDPATRKDSLLAPIVRLTNFGNFTFYGSRIFFLGAVHPDYPGANVVAYDLATRAWSKEPNVPADSLIMATAATAGVLYALIGDGTAWDPFRVAALDLATHTWSTKKRHAFQYVMTMREVDGTVYLASSLDGPISTTWEKYAPADDAWIPMPSSERMQARLYTRLVGVNGVLYSLGGSLMDPNGSNVVDRFDAAKNAWVAAPDFLIGRHGPGVAAVGSSIYIIGGMANGALTPKIEEYRP